MKVTDREMHSRRKMQIKDRRKELQKLKAIEDKCPCFDMTNGHRVCSELHMAVALRSDGWLAGGHWAVPPPSFPPPFLNPCF